MIFKEHYEDESTCAKIIINEMNTDDIYQGIFNIHSKEDMVIVDVGANVGLFTLFMYPICKKIYAVEPTPSHLKLLTGLKDTFQLDNCVISKNAISDKNGNVTFNTNSGNSTMNSLVGPASYPADYDDKVEVAGVRLDDYLDRNNIEHVDFMKMDIEGGEQIVVFSEGFAKAAERIKSMYIEIHMGLGADAQGILNELGKHFSNVYQMPYQHNPGFYLTK
jgi:FkbM family methyltransferase